MLSAPARRKRMPYRVAGIDVHNEEASRSCGGRRSRRGIPIRAALVRKQPGAVAQAGGMADRAASRGSGDGIHGSILETAVERTGTVLETELSESGRCRENVGNTPSGTGVVQSRPAGTEERFSRCGTFGEAVDFPGVGLELCARWRTALVALTDPRQVSTDAGQSPSAESTGGTAGRSPNQVVQFGFGPAGPQCTTNADGAGGRRNRSGGAGRVGPPTLAGDAGAAARCTGRLRRAQPGLPPTGEDGPSGLAIDRAADRPT